MEVNADEPVEGVFSGQNHCDSDDAQAKSDSRSLKDPVEHGIVNNRDDLSTLEQGGMVPPHTLVDIPRDEKSPKSTKTKILHYWGKYWRGEIKACALFSLLWCSGLLGVLLWRTMPVWIALPERFQRNRRPWALIAQIIIITIWTIFAWNAWALLQHEAEKELTEELAVSFPDSEDFQAALQNLTPQLLGRIEEVVDESNIAWGALSFSAMRRGFVWTFVSYAFLHSTVHHWLGNILVMAAGGWKLNQLIGHKQFCGIFLITAIGAATTQFAFCPLGQLTVRHYRGSDYAPLLGASGVADGIYGAFCCIVIVYWEKLKAAKVTMMLVFATVVLKLIGDFASGASCAVMHLGGFASGVLYVVAFGPCTWNQEFKNVHTKRIGKVGTRVGIVVLTLFLLVPGVICFIRANNL